jgi:ATP-dependent exoDNAse (exonuclease V) alpha subunit
VVRFLIQRKDEDIIMVRHDWVSDNIPGVGISQIPLILAWALTIHKCQGATLDVAEIDIGSGIFECGQTYVALSRVRSLDGLYLNSFDPTRIKISRKVKNYYDDLMGFWETHRSVVEDIPIAVPVLLEEQREVKIQKSSNPFQSFACPNNNIPIVTAEPI